MTTTTTTTTACTYILLQWLLYLPISFLIYLFTKRLFNKLSNLPPSPFLSLPVLGHLYLASGNLFHRALARVSDRYGPIVLLQFGSRRLLLVSSPEIVEECFTKNDVVFANRPNMLAGKHLGYNFTSMLWSPIGDHWRNIRKLSILEILSNHRIDLLGDIRADEVRMMIGELNEAGEEGRPVNMSEVLLNLTMNVLMRMIAGKRYYGANVEEAEEARRFREIIKEALRLGGSQIADFVPIVKWLGLDKAEKQMQKVQKERDDFVQELVVEWKQKQKVSGKVLEGKATKKTMIELMLDLQEKDPNYYTDIVIRSFLMLMLFAGSDTSSETMQWALSLLLNNPRVLKKVQAEIDGVVGQDRLLTESDLANLPYLRCIIYETLRMKPVVPLLAPHQSYEPCTIGGYHVPGNTMLLVNAWAIHNDPKNWENPHEFKPERFEMPQSYKDKFKLIPFGVGRRGCPGEGLGLRMVGFGLGTLIQCFEWNTMGNEPIDMTEAAGMTLPRAIPLTVFCNARPVVGKLING